MGPAVTRSGAIIALLMAGPFGLLNALDPCSGQTDCYLELKGLACKRGSEIALVPCPKILPSDPTGYASGSYSRLRMLR